MKSYLRVVLGFGIPLFLLSNFLSAQGWMRTWGGPSGDGAEWVEVTSDSGFIVLGGSLVPESVGFWEYGSLTKTNSGGGMLWFRCYPSQNMVKSTELNCVEKTSGGGYIMTGKVVLFPDEALDQLWLVKTDSFGNILWTRNYGGEGVQDGKFLRETGDGGYIVVGEWQTKVDGQRQTDLWALRTDSLGDTLWTRMFGGNTANDKPESVNLCSDGGFLITGRKENEKYLWILKLNSTGKLLWEKGYTSSGSIYGNYGEETSDGGYIFTGQTDINRENMTGLLYVLKTDSKGDSVWASKYGTSYQNYGACVHETPDGGYIVAGGCNQYGLFDPTGQGWLLKLDSSGDTVWTRTITYDSDGDNSFSCIQFTPDGGYILAGEAGDYEAEKGYEYWLVKTDSEGYVGVVEEPFASNPTEVEPRSTVGRGVKLSYSDMPQGFHALVFDSIGRKVDELHSSLTSGTVEWGAGHSPGVYFIKPLGNSQKAFKVVLVK